MTFRLPRFDRTVSLVDTATGQASYTFHQWWQSVINAIETQENTQDAMLQRIRRMLSHTDPTTIMTATENGVSATVVIDNHARVYGDATTLNVSGMTHTGLLCDTLYGVYYDDETLADMTPTYVFTTIIADAQAAKAAGRHWTGAIRTPPAGSGKVRAGGGAYPISSSVGGEIG